MNKKIILMIDDEENFCQLVKKNIELTGEFEVHVATNGDDGIRLAREISPDEPILKKQRMELRNLFMSWMGRSKLILARRNTF